MGKNREVIDRKFGWRDKLGYLFGDFGNDFTFILSSSFLLKFYTDVMGISAAVVGVVMMVARFVMLLRMWLWDGFVTVREQPLPESSNHGFSECAVRLLSLPF